MQMGYSRLAGLLGMTTLLIATAQANALLVKGAWPSASDSATPLPEGGRVSGQVYDNRYFGLTYSLSSEWGERYEGPPPSPSGYYVLAQIEPTEKTKRASQGHGLIVAQDMFFTATPMSTTAELMDYSKSHLDPELKIERPPAGVRIANHDFVRFDYGSPVAQLHWHVLATQIRCHTVQFVFTGRDPKFLEALVHGMDTLRFSKGDLPRCIKDFANPQNLISGEEPVLAETKFNPIPVRIIIGTDGKIKHMHFLSAFPEQSRSIAEALSQWQFKPYLVDGSPVEVETGIMFGRRTAPRATTAFSNPEVPAATH
jgi:hypothetical protein